MFQLKTCCGVFSLRTGSLIILSIHLIIGLLMALLPGISNSIDYIPSGNTRGEVLSDSGEVIKKTTTTPRTEIDLKKFSDEYSLNYRAVEAIRMWSPPAGWILIVTSSSAIYGVFKSKPMFILPFILCSILIMFLLAVVEVAVASRQFLFCTVGYLILHSEIFIYFILVLNSHYRIIAGYFEDA